MKLINKKRINEIVEESFINKYLKDEGVTDVKFNGTFLTLKHNKKGKIVPKDQPDIEEVRRFIRNIADEQNKQITDTNPILDTEIGFLRVNSVHPKISPDGQSFAIRVSRPRLVVPDVKSFTKDNSADLEQLLKVLMLAEKNSVLCGRTGAGKTEFQKTLVSYIPDVLSIGLIEDTRDSHIKTLYPKKDITSWVINKELGITAQTLVQASLRNDFDWTILAETRGVEASDLLDSAKTDHAVTTTLHSKRAVGIPSRFMAMIRQAPAYARMEDVALGKEIVENFPFGIYLKPEKNDNGETVRMMKELVEFTGFTQDGPEYRYIYRLMNQYDKKTGEYLVKEEFNPLSERVLDDLMDAKVFHLLPDFAKQ